MRLRALNASSLCTRELQSSRAAPRAALLLCSSAPRDRMGRRETAGERQPHAQSLPPRGRDAQLRGIGKSGADASALRGDRTRNAYPLGRPLLTELFTPPLIPSHHPPLAKGNPIVGTPHTKQDAGRTGLDQGVGQSEPRAQTAHGPTICEPSVDEHPS